MRVEITKPLGLRGLTPLVAREPYRSLSGLALAPWRLSPGCRAVAGPEPSRSLNIYILLMNFHCTDVKPKNGVLSCCEMSMRQR